MVEEYSLYFHVPFCRRKCDYCHFYVQPEREDAKELLLKGLLLEWQSYLPLLKHKRPLTLYFGGGTPTLFSSERLKKLLEGLSLDLSACKEITLEANPEEVTPELIAAYAACGINRVSLGVQSLNDSELKILGRTHDSARVAQAIDAIVAAGITNLSIDLMYDLPDQTLESWKRTLSQAVSFPITHLSLYNLTIEPHTAFDRKRRLLTPRLPSSEASAAMFEEACDALTRGGFDQYEISAFARQGKIAVHNSGYWTDRPFLGLGPSAYSYWGGERFRNIPHLKKYVEALEKGESPVDEREKLDPIAHVKELFVLRLRLLQEGVDLKRFVERYGALPKELDQGVRKLIGLGLLKEKEGVLKLTHQGVLFYDTVASELI